MPRPLSPFHFPSRPAWRTAIAVAVATMLTACVNLAPDYQRPAPAVPERSVAAVAASSFMLRLMYTTAR